ncbi:LPS export ABC transporter periplasmic protein LptC [Thetidibacter halocola]|uniref:LPS export ABC transporter periplasmic protein LptC n=1 Tax=Thetidibacter halocola TaxID=2827239 RepID=A0A8J7WI14_9RHOB|nr:LPS export ABC transporter periplasmic protein LptC [Thetidibacter halocola]MBS0125666.1 LPS export ABC transporter periplasmic protein LptC [Thetidibacter halocola]
MARRDGAYSRVIAWLKILLPMIALALLSSLFLLSRKSEPDMRVPFSDALSETDLGQENVRRASYAGMTERGDMLTMTAGTVRAVGDGNFEAEGIAARMTLLDGGEVTLDARRALMRQAEDDMVLSGDVLFRNDAGFELRTDSLTASINRIAAQSGGPVTGTGPGAIIEAGRMEIEAVGKDDDLILRFSGGVRTVWQPE